MLWLAVLLVVRLVCHVRLATECRHHLLCVRPRLWRLRMPLIGRLRRMTMLLPADCCTRWVLAETVCVVPELPLFSPVVVVPLPTPLLLAVPSSCALPTVLCGEWLLTPFSM